ncbi:MAG: glycosyltransferase family 2 protein [Methanobacterium sp.]|jgi:GT2 family glycosyltransferase
MNMLKKTSIIIVTYNHINYIGNCLNSLLDERLEIIVVDNKSNDGTPEYIENNFPKVKLIRNKVNSGYGAGNNLGVKNSSRDYLVILNPDTKIEKYTIKNLLNPLENDRNLVIIPKILYYDGRKINTCGNKLHFTGMAFTRGNGEKPNSRNKSRFVNGLSGACFAISKDNYLKLDGFDESIFLYMEDTELSWRIHSKGLKIIYVPESVVYHDYSFNVNSEKIYYVEKGRYMILRKYFTIREYFLFLPSLIMTEVLTWGYAIIGGPKSVYSKFRALYDGFSIPLNNVTIDHKILLTQMNHKIPKLNFKFTNIYNIFRMLANFVYILNLKLIR